MQTNDANSSVIIVIPFDCTTLEIIPTPLKVHKLNFWFNKTYDHPVNEQNVERFLSQLKMFKPTIDLRAQELKCCAVDVPSVYNHGQAGVHEICYMGEIVYCRC
jgi:hypothetical protein